MKEESIFEDYEEEERPSEKHSVTGFWSEKIFVVTEDYEIKGYVFMPKTGKETDAV